MNATQEVRRKLATAPSELRLAVLFSPRTRRAALTALFAVYLEIRGILQACSDAGVARTKLAWWQEEVQLLSEHRPRHPLSKTLDQHTQQYPLSPPLLFEITESVAIDIGAVAFNSFNDVEKYCNQRGGALMEAAAALTGPVTPDTLVATRLLGRSWQLTDIVLNGLQYAEHGRIYFSSDDLRKHGLDRHISGESHSIAGVQALLEDYATRASAVHASALALSTVLWSELRAGLVLSGLAQARLEKFARHAYRTTAAQVELHPFTQLLTAWRSARHAH